MPQLSTNITFFGDEKTEGDQLLSLFTPPAVAGRVNTVSLPLIQYCWIESAAPDTSHASSHPIVLRDLARGLGKVDITSITGKNIIQAYIQATNFISQPLETRKVTIQRCGKAWTPTATWNKYDGTNNWEAGGGKGTTDQSSTVYTQTVVRPTAWDDNWSIDITPLVKAWCDGSQTNNGFFVSCDGDLQLFSVSGTWVNYGMKLIVKYADSASTLTNGSMPDADKLANAFGALHLYRYSGYGAWQSAGTKNAMANASKFPDWSSSFLTKLQGYLDVLLKSDGTFVSAMNNYYAGPPFGEAFIRVHQATGVAKYKTAIDIMKDYVLAHNRDVNDIIREDLKIETELVYCVMVFIACYAETYGDPNNSNSTLAIDQTTRLYDVLTAGQSDGVPYHANSYYNSPKGRIGKGWGRGVGWLFGGMGKLVTYSCIRNNPLFPNLLARYKALAAALEPLQKANGMWRGLVHDPTKPDESTGTALIGIGYECGIQTGMLDKRYILNSNKAMKGLLKYTKTGLEMGQAYPENQNFDYQLSDYQSNDYAFGLFAEFATIQYRRNYL